MKGYKGKILFSWIFLSMAAIIWVALQPDFFAWKLFLLLAMAPRINGIEKQRFEEISNNPTFFTKIGFIYMLGWLAYILFIYFKTSGNTDQILGNLQLILFILPIFAIFIISDIKWYLACNEADKT